MNQYGSDQKSQRRERWLDQYVLGLESGDVDAITEVLYAALDDPELDRLIHEINAAYEEEEHLVSLAQDAENVRALAQQHLPSAFEREDESPAPVTIGEVAAYLHAKRRVPFTDAEINNWILTNSGALPQPLSLPAVKKLFEEMLLNPSQRFIRVFYDAAITLSMARSHNQAQLAARKQQTHRTTQNRANQPNQPPDKMNKRGRE